LKRDRETRKRSRESEIGERGVLEKEERAMTVKHEEEKQV